MENNDSCDKAILKKLEYSAITEDIKRKAESELNETEETRKRCLKGLKHYIQEEANLVADTSDEFLLQFLRAKKFKIYAAFLQLKKFYTHRMMYSSLYKYYSPKQNLKVLHANLLNFLPHRTSEDCAIWIARVGLWDPEAFDHEELLRLGLLCHEKALQNPVTQICGIVSIVDFQGFSWTHLFHMPGSYIRCFVSVVQDCFPIRHKAIHVINNPFIFGLLFSIIKPFLTFKIRNRIHFHSSNLNSLHQFIPPALLPKEFGGTQGTFENEQFYKLLLDSEEEFLERQKYGYKIGNLG